MRELTLYELTLYEYAPQTLYSLKVNATMRELTLYSLKVNATMRELTLYSLNNARTDPLLPPMNAFM
jgi:hypothetical protein